MLNHHNKILYLNSNNSYSHLTLFKILKPLNKEWTKAFKHKITINIKGILIKIFIQIMSIRHNLDKININYHRINHLDIHQ
jgi:hypothetical protein